MIERVMSFVTPSYMQQKRLLPARSVGYALLAAAIVACVLWWWKHNKTSPYYPENLSSSRLPISPAEQSNDVIAKFEINTAQVNRVIEWYRDRAFSTGSDSEQIYGFGPDGVSFSLYTTNKARTLVVKQWKDD